MKQEDTRQKILAKALELFSVHGYDAVSVGQIAAAVGIKAPSLYNHFPSKRAMAVPPLRWFSGRKWHLIPTKTHQVPQIPTLVSLSIRKAPGDCKGFFSPRCPLFLPQYGKPILPPSIFQTGV